MRVLVLGADGMLGSVLMARSSEFFGTVRQNHPGNRILCEIDISSKEDLRRALDWCEPLVVVNCAGIVKSECHKYTESRVMEVNGEAPHRIAEVAEEYGRRVIHISTDCVFNGTRGNRVETDRPDATDVYGSSKAAGELSTYSHCVTLRTSFIGRDHKNSRGLIEWLLAQRNSTAPVPGYMRAMWSGLSTHELARAVELTITHALCGLYHVSGPIISKYDLLRTLADVYGINCDVVRLHDPLIDRSLYGARFQQTTGYVAPSWLEMAKELAAIDVSGETRP